MRVVVALGGNALMQRGAPMTVGNQRASVATACAALAPVALGHELVITHGIGPQVGLLALQASAYDSTTAYPFDVLGAQTEGTMYEPGTRRLIGVEGVIFKDRASAVLARDLRADLLVIATDTDAVYVGWGKPDQRAIAVAHPDDLARFEFPAGSMGPKVGAAIGFACGSGRDALIGAPADLPALPAGEAGTRVSVASRGVTYR